VPHIILKDDFDGPVEDGKLGDVAPTILALIDEEVPDSMDGNVLVPTETPASAP
jgi:2,3-bisphosphoglycerate-independent phosphoglycerate mutase